jgi:hypothetical protein
MMPAMSKALDLHSPLTVAIAVTGHRFLQDTEELISAIDRVLAAIQARWPDLSLTVISSLAEGGDRLVTQRALALFGARLIVPLPMPVDEYICDFRQDGSAEEFRLLLDQAAEIVCLPVAPDREAAYAAAGDYLLTHSDIVIALWDGQPAQGDGGTGAVVTAARRAAHPLVWIQTCNNLPRQGLSLDRGTQGRVSYENL